MRKPADEKEADLKFVHYTSPYFERIRYELMRYCSGEINGLSVLISGQRGAGKTTLTKLVIQKVMQESKALIPLPLLLHGPTIIDSEAATSDPDEDSGSKRSAPLEKEKALGAAIKFEDIIPEVAGVYPKIMLEGQMDAGAWSCGMVAGLIHDIPTCKELIDTIMAEAEQIVRGRLVAMFDA